MQFIQLVHEATIYSSSMVIEKKIKRNKILVGIVTSRESGYVFKFNTFNYIYIPKCQVPTRTS